MIWTNKNNIAPEIAEAIIKRAGQYKHGGNFSVTEILNSPRQAQLLKRHADEIEQDVSEMLSSWEGHLIHDAIQMDLPRAEIFFNGVKLSGEADYWKDGVLKDYKTTSVWSIIHGSHLKKWEQQLNIYAYMYESYFDWKTDRIIVEAYLTDWQYGKSITEKGYPKSKQFPIPIPMWDAETTKKFIAERLMLHAGSMILADDDLPSCSNEDMWARPSTWAVIKEGNVKALRVLSSLEDAQHWVSLKYPLETAEANKISILHRPGEFTRCDRYCPQRKFCNQWHARQDKNTTSSMKSEAPTEE